MRSASETLFYCGRVTDRSVKNAEKTAFIQYFILAWRRAGRFSGFVYAALRETYMKTCPKCGYERRPEDPADAGICPSCGLVFAKWVSRTLGTARLPHENDQSDREAGGSRFGALFAQLTTVEPRTDAIPFWGRVALFAAFVVWGFYFVSLDLRTNDIGASFMHRVNLVFHEAGHVIFIPFGQFMHILGGSLGQLLMPAIVIGVLVVKNHDNFGASIGLWWFGQSLKDLAPYINDARDLQLQLLTGHSQDVPETHDWANILLDLGLIFREKKIALGADIIGSLIILLALAWGAYLLLQQYRNLDRD
jgi:hypothetical protein